MSSRTSVYAVTEAEPPKWKPGEESAAAAFIGIALWLVFDTLFCVVRVFKKRRGLYFWSILLGILGLSVDAMGVILKYLTPGTEHIWGLYSFFLLGGWAVYAPAQLLVLYSRLHLVSDIEWVRRTVLYMILSVYLTMILPTWICNWQSYNPDPKITSVWSPRTAIVERYTQIGLTLVECIVSGVYVWSLLALLRGKVTVRQRRVMTDLIYVNVIAVAFDILTVIFIYLNQLGISHPIQTFSYALKFKLEFLVLNQLMAVAARGIQKKSWEEKRYFNPDVQDGFSAEAQRWAASSPPPSQAGPDDLTEGVDPLEDPPGYDTQSDPQRLSVPPAARSHSNRNSSIMEIPSPSPRMDPSNPNAFSFAPEPKLDLRRSLIENNPVDTPQPPTPQTQRPSEAYSGDTLQPSADSPREESPHLFPRRLHRRKRRTMEMIREHKPHGHRNRERYPSQQRSHLDFNPNLPVNATLRRSNPRKQSREDDEDDEEEIGVHMWERRGTILLCAPWMERREAQEERERQGV